MQLKILLILLQVPPLILLLIVMAIISLVTLNGSVNDWTGQIQDHVLTEERAHIIALAENVALFTSRRFARMTADTLVVREYAQRLVEQDLIVTAPYQTYHIDATVDTSTAPTDNRMASSWFRLHNTNAGDQSFLANSSALDNVWRTLPSLYQASGLGLEVDGFLRSFPLSRSSIFGTMKYLCRKNNTQVTGYDPRCRHWYTGAKALTPGTTTEVFYTPPYVDAFSGDVVISSSAPVWHPGTTNLFGVIFNDIQFSDLESFYRSNNILENGFPFLLDDVTAQLLYYPGMSRDSPKYFRNLHFSDATESAAFSTSFNTSAAQAKATFQTSSFTYIRNGELWQASVSSVNGTTYLVGVVVPEKDIRKPVADVVDAAKNALAIALTVIIIVIVVMLLASVVLNVTFSNTITGAIMHLVGVTDSLASGGETKGTSKIKEIYNLQDSFMKLTGAVKFSNPSSVKISAEEVVARLGANKGRHIEQTSKNGFQFSLAWDAAVDLDLHLETPKGKVYFGNRRVAGAELDVDRMPPFGDVSPVENIVCDKAVPGTYTAKVNWYGGYIDGPCSYALHCRVGEEHNELVCTEILARRNTDSICTFVVNRNGEVGEVTMLVPGIPQVPPASKTTEALESSLTAEQMLIDGTNYRGLGAVQNNVAVYFRASDVKEEWGGRATALAYLKKSILAGEKAVAAVGAVVHVESENGGEIKQEVSECRSLLIAANNRQLNVLAVNVLTNPVDYEAIIEKARSLRDVSGEVAGYLRLAEAFELANQADDALSQRKIAVQVAVRQLAKIVDGNEPSLANALATLKDCCEAVFAAALHMTLIRQNKGTSEPLDEAKLETMYQHLNLCLLASALMEKEGLPKHSQIKEAQILLAHVLAKRGDLAASTAMVEDRKLELDADVDLAPVKPGMTLTVDNLITGEAQPFNLGAAVVEDPTPRDIRALRRAQEHAESTTAETKPDLPTLRSKMAFRFGIAYGIFILLVFIVCLVVSLTTTERVKIDLRDALQDQVQRQATSLMKGVARAFGEDLNTASESGTDMIGRATADVFRTTPPYCLADRISYYDLGGTTSADFKPPLEVHHGFTSSLNASSLYVPGELGNASALNASVNATASTTSNLDPFFASIYSHKKDSYFNLAAGFAENSLYRRIPAIDTNAFDPNRLYNPTTRDWYTAAEAAPGTSIYTTPYRDFNTKLWMISVSSAARANTTIAAVVGVATSDILLRTLVDSIRSLRVLDSGKITLVDHESGSTTSALVVADQEWAMADSDATIFTLDTLTKPAVTADMQSFITQTSLVAEASNTRSATFGTTYAGETGSQSVMVIPTRLSGFGDRYYFTAFVKESEVFAAFEPLLAEIQAVNTTLSLILVLVWACACLVAGLTIFAASTLVTNPIAAIGGNVQKMVDNIGSPDLTKGCEDIDSAPYDSAALLAKNFNRMVQTMRESSQTKKTAVASPLTAKSHLSSMKFVPAFSAAVLPEGAAELSHLWDGATLGANRGFAAAEPVVA